MHKNLIESGQQIIRLDSPVDDIDFVTLHNILYFIYIGCVNLPFIVQKLGIDYTPEGFPEEADPFCLFQNADKFLLPELKELCKHSLIYVLTPKNVAERLFHPACESHAEVREACFNYLIEHFHEVRETEEWERIVCFDEDVSPATARYRARLWFDISKKLKL